MPHVAITGSTGHVGGTAARILSDAGIAVRLLVREPARAPDLPHAEVVRADYGHVRECVAALAGIDTVFMVSIIDGTDRRLQQQDFIDAVAQTGVRQVVYLSFVGAAEDAAGVFTRHHGVTETYLADADLDVTILRVNYYAEALVQLRCEDGFRAPVSDGRVAAVARADVGAAVAAVLRDPRSHVGQVYELSGPEALTFTEIAALFEQITGQPHRFVDESDQESRSSRADYGAPADELEAWLSMFRAIRHGVHGHVTGDVRHLLGRDPVRAVEALSPVRP